MKLCELKPAIGSKHHKKILGHGQGSGHGGSSTRGTKGQKARSGGAKSPWFEGGQTPLVRRLPKRGFTNKPFKKEYNYVNLGILENKFLEGSEITPQLLFDTKIIKNKSLPVKILANGTLTKKFKIVANKFSKSAIEKIKSCGGEVMQC
ncbi:MAG: 50S ribosomal protein L15 [Elusimicrobiota bacterium]|nr:50S ribosomal protein L15 [Elusimicrobiota bacterium]